jgi:manganese transport protein
VVETVGAMIYGENIDDHETLIDKKIRRIQSNIDRKGFQVETKLGLENQIEYSRTY